MFGRDVWSIGGGCSISLRGGGCCFYENDTTEGSGPLRIVLATWNPDKIRWLTKGFEALNLIEPIDPVQSEGCEEDGEICRENAEKKALSVGIREDALVVAEDSGLCCDGLGGFLDGRRVTRPYPTSSSP